MQERQNKFLIPIAILIAGGLIAWGIIATNKKTNSTEGTTSTTNTEQSTIPSTTVVRVLETDYILGNPDADLILINFSDFECAFCKIFHQTMHQVINEYGKDGSVAWIFRQFPLHGTTAEKKAAAAKCAGKLGGNNKFWEMSDKIFQFDFSGDKETTTEQLSKIAENISLDKKQFLECLNNDTTLDIVKQEYQSGVSVGVLDIGTPHTIILTKVGKTYPISGAQPYNTIKSVIDLILGEN